MQIDQALILRLENLAKLELSGDERNTLLHDLNDILAMVEKLHELDTSAVAPLEYISEGKIVLREDIVAQQLNVKEALANAPNHDGQYFIVPRVL